MPAIDGLISGLDTTSIIDGLVAIQQSQVDRLNIRRDEILVQQTAFQGIEARLLSLQSNTSRLNRSVGSVFDANSVSTSNEDVLTATANNGATQGSFVLRVNALAQANQVASQGFDSNANTISQGTIEFQVGNRPATTIVVDDTNDTLTGLVNAINEQSDDISASIVRDQATNSDRILLTAQETGAVNQINITNNLAASSGSAVRPDFSGPAVQEATNAIVQLGSGPGAIVAEFESNVVDDLIQNVTLNLASAAPDQDITVNVSRNIEPAREAINEFVAEFNALVDFIDQQTAFNPETNVASPLIGNRNVTTIQNTLSTIVTETVAGLGGNLNRLSQIGVQIDGRGRLTVNSAELNSALNGEVEGIDSSDIRRLFGLTGQSDNAGVEFLLGSSNTQTSPNGIEVDITQAAEQASVTAANTIAGSITIDQTNNQFQVSVDGLQSEVLTLVQGTFTGEEIAANLQAVINSSPTLIGRQVSVAFDGASISISSDSFGSSSEISGFAGSAATALGFDGSESDQGLDVEGVFLIDGVAEAATGSGRVLIGDSGNENTADLQALVTLSASQVSDGAEASLNVTRGVTSSLNQFFSDVLDSTTGTLQNVNEDFELRIESLDASIARVNAVTEAQTEFLIQQFATLERTLSELQSTSGFLASQLG